MLVFRVFMILNITYPSPKLDQAIKEQVGLSFSFLERIKMKGIGSRKMQIIDCSPSILSLLKNNNDTKYCNIELRKKGVVVGFQSTMRIYAWLIPYYQLSTYFENSTLKVYSLQDHIKMKAPFNGTIERPFLHKMFELKTKYLADQDFR